MNLQDMIFSYQQIHRSPEGVDLHRTFAGVYCQHSWAALFVYEKLLNAFPRIDLIIELGSGFGGLSLYFAAFMAQRGGSFHTFDTNRERMATRSVLAALNTFNRRGTIRFHPQDIYSDETKHEIAEAVNEATQVLFLCDGGDKRRELAMYSPVLGVDDLLISHDYGEEVNESHIPCGWGVLQPWQAQAEEMGTRQLILRRLP